MMFCYNLVPYMWMLWKKRIEVAKTTPLRRPGLWLSFDSILLNGGMSNFIWNAVNINVKLETELKKKSILGLLRDKEERDVN